MDRPSSISVKKLSKHYPGKTVPALDHIDLEIYKGEVFGILGPNGAGKTTLFSILCGIMKPSAGEATIEGLSIKNEMEDIKKLFGIAPQEIALYEALSGRNNLLFIGRMYGIKNKELYKRVDDYLDKFGFDDNRHQLVKNYSGGMRRRINLLAGILHQPSILLLDEPTVGVDVQTRAQMMEYLKLLNKELAMTILYTSHHLEEAEQFCDRLAIIDNGRIFTIGSPGDLIQSHKVNSLQQVFLKLTGNALRD